MMFSNFTDSDYGNHYETLYALGQIVQLITIFIAMLVTCLACYIFLKVPQFHKNMIALIFNLFVEGVIVYVCKIILIIEWFLCKQDCYNNTPFILSQHITYIELIKLASGTAYISAMPFIVMERTLATIQLKTYEQHINFYFIAYCIISQYIGGALITYIFYNEIISVTYIFIVGETISILLTTTIFVVDRINRLRYKQSTTIGTSYTLSERFQLSENIRSARLMKNSIFVSTIGNILIIFFFAWSWSVQDFEYKRWMKFAYDFGTAIYGIVFPIVGLLSSDLWTRMLLGILGRLKQVIPLSTSTTSDSLNLEVYNMKTTTGKRMVFTIEQEQQVYFDQLRKSWDIPRVQ